MTHGATNPIAGDAGKIYVLDVELDNVAVTTADSTSYNLYSTEGTSLSNGTLTYTASLPVEGLTQHAAWFANVLWPSTAQDVVVKMVITKTSAPKTWQFKVPVQPAFP